MLENVFRQQGFIFERVSINTKRAISERRLIYSFNKQLHYTFVEAFDLNSSITSYGFYYSARE